MFLKVTLTNKTLGFLILAEIRLNGVAREARECGEIWAKGNKASDIPSLWEHFHCLNLIKKTNSPELRYKVQTYELY